MNQLHNKATFAAQKNFSSACFFMPFYLVNPNKSVTHTHTHTHTFYSSKSLYKGDSSARRVRGWPASLSICKELSKLFADAFSRVCN